MYAATKGVLVSMARTIGADLAPRNIPEKRQICSTKEIAALLLIFR
jgi:hypothetical protein